MARAGAARALLLVVLLSVARRASCVAYTVGYLTNMLGRDNPLRQGLVISGAVTYAIDLVNNSSLLHEHELRLMYNDTEGDTLVATRVVIDQWRRGVVAYFGPEDSCEVEAAVAASLNLPMISYKCADSRVSKKEFYKTFARTYPPDKGVVSSILVLLKYYRWSKFTIISEQNTPYMTVAKSFEKQALRHNFTINNDGIKYFDNFHVCCEDALPCCSDIFNSVIEDTYMFTRVYVFFGRTGDMIQLLTTLKMKKILDTKEYVVIYVDIEAYSESVPFKYFWRMDMHESVVDLVKDAARSLLVILPTPPRDKHYPEFLEKVREYNSKEPFKFPNALPFVKHITEFAAYLYDSVFLYATALAETLDEGEDPRNGTYIIQKIISRGGYKSVTGAWMHIDENGDVAGNYTVLALLTAPEAVEIKGFNYRKNMTEVMLPMGNFQFDEETRKPVFKPLDVFLDWVAPLEEPPCGYSGNDCKAPVDSTKEITAIILGVTLAIVAVGSWICYKNWKYEQEIAGLLWKIRIEDIQRLGPEGLPSSPSKMSVTSQMSLESKMVSQVFTQTAIYKGVLVATKTLKFSRKNFEIQRDIKKEMKIMRDMHHDNINQFIGACILSNSIFIVTEYCAKGSLQDILKNDDIKLDDMFIASLVFDLIKGMNFLHESDLKVHGNLKSPNCVVTSRWVLQVADFGLRQFYKEAERETSTNIDSYRRLLWKAPETIRNPSAYPKGTQKADVYAFAIILHEIIMRQGPFSNCLPPDEIISKVLDGPQEANGELFRPPLNEFVGQDYIRQTMIECWAEKPENRPDFRHIREKLSKMKQGMKSNIMDNMMSIMERYANNLEDLVDDRTAQLVEEQKKTEALLHRMLPKSVAEQLMRGEAVIPESFDSVTVYFSDIVGFTELSASSTPMEVVTFLNDLYTVFDSIIGNYDVYKVETIGDAYMVVSGLPIRNGEQHAGHVACMALDLLEAVKSFHILHKPAQTLKLRIGIHSGPVVAGVVGLTMPRYCLFGDTVNTASRMESSGEALKIHISEQCRLVLESLGGYQVQPRGLVKIKGKGELQTYWLVGHEGAKSQAKESILPAPLFATLDASDSWHRSPKGDTSRRGSSATTRCVEDTPPLSNGSVPGIPVFLRCTQDSPRTSRRPWQAFRRRESDTLDGDALTEDFLRPASIGEDNFGVNGNGVVGARRHLSGGDNRPRNSFVNAKADGANPYRRRLTLVRQPSKRWRSCDEFDLPKTTLKEWFAGLFNNARLSEADARRLNNASSNLLQPVKETEKEESLV